MFQGHDARHTGAENTIWKHALGLQSLQALLANSMVAKKRESLNNAGVERV